MTEFPDIKMITVHDSIIFPANRKREVLGIFLKEKNLELNLI
jgi:hypothetical protein